MVTRCAYIIIIIIIIIITIVIILLLLLNALGILGQSKKRHCDGRQIGNRVRILCLLDTSLVIYVPTNMEPVVFIHNISVFIFQIKICSISYLKI